MRSDSIRSNVGERWLILAVLFFARTAMAFQFQAVAALSSFFIADFRLDFTQLGLLIGLYLLPGTVIAYPGGLLGRHLGDKRVALLGMVLMVAGGVLTASPHYPTLLAGRLASGIGAVLLNVLLTKMTTDWFVGREIGTALALLVTSWPFGIGLALVVLPWLAARTSFAAALASTAAVAALVLMLIAAIYRVPPPAIAPAPSNKEAGRAPVAARARPGVVGGRRVDAVQCRLHPGRQLQPSPADVARAVPARRRLRDQPGLLDRDRHHTARRRSDRSKSATRRR